LPSLVAPGLWYVERVAGYSLGKDESPSARVCGSKRENQGRKCRAVAAVLVSAENDDDDDDDDDGDGGGGASGDDDEEAEDELEVKPPSSGFSPPAPS
jgi:hypothetical protein